MLYLKADTITEVTIGPAVAVGDGFTPVTNLVGSSADEFEIIKHGATTTTTIAGTLAAITGADGYYALDLSATDTNTEGRLTVLINDDSLILPIRHEFMVVNANVFDSLFAAAATDYLQTDAIQVGGDTQSATDLKDFADAGYDPASNKVQGVVLVDTLTTYTGKTVQTADVASGVTLAAGAITDASLAGNMEIVFETDFATNYNTTRKAWATNAQDFVGTTGSDPFNGQVVAASVTGHTAQTGDSYAYLGTNLGGLGTNASEAGGTGDHLSAIPWNPAWDTEVESEVNDALDTAIAELGVAAPTATPTIRTGLMLLYMALRNKTVVQTSGTDALEIYNNAGTKIAAKLLTDDGSDYTEAEMA